MTVEFTIRVAGLLKATDTAVVYVGLSISAVAVNKAIVVTSNDPMEFITDDIEYIASNVQRDYVDEVVDLSDAAIENDSDIVAAIQSAAQMALLVGEPGPVAVKFLERVVSDDRFAEHQMDLAQRKLGKATAKKAAKAPAKKAAKPSKKAGEDEEKWYISADGHGWTTDVSQAKLDKKGKPWRVSTEVAHAS